MKEPLIIHYYEPYKKVLVDDYDIFPDLPKDKSFKITFFKIAYRGHTNYSRIQQALIKYII